MIKVTNIKKNFGDLQVLKGINYEIEKGQVISIIGPSGSGKSTFLRCLNLIEQPTSGVIEYNKEVIFNKTYKDLKNELNKIEDKKSKVYKEQFKNYKQVRKLEKNLIRILIFIVKKWVWCSNISTFFLI